MTDGVESQTINTGKRVWTIEWDWRTIVTIVIIVLTLASRFAMLGVRTMSHDEVNHVVPAYDLSIGKGYQHNPITHGPFQFHVLALSYFLFGDNDTTSRIPAALFSTAAVFFVLWGFRRYLGKNGAIFGSICMLISPYVLFYGRYTRNEAFIELIAVVMIYAVLRYLETGDKLSLFLFTISNALHFTVKETSYIYAAIVLIFLAIVLLERLTQEKWPSEGKRKNFVYLMLGAFLSLGVTLGLAVINGSKPAAAPADGTTTPANVGILAGELIALAITAVLAISAVILVVRSLGWYRIKHQRSFDLIVVCMSLLLPVLSAFPLKMLGFNPTDYSNTTAMVRAGIAIGIMTILMILIGFWWDRQRWIPQAIVFYGIFIVFYTTFFTNGAGFFTGILGSLGYWLEQQGVQRGTQSWYYYAFLQVPFYEFLAVVGSLLAVYIGVRYKKFSQWIGLEPYENPELPVEAAGGFEDTVVLDESDLPAEAMLIKETVEEVEEPLERSLVELDSLAEAGAEAEVEINEIPIEHAKKLPVLAFLLFLSVMNLIAYTMAGEKMPWLTVHIAIPMLLTTGWSVGYIFDSTPWQQINKKQTVIGLFIGLLMAVGLSAMLKSWFSSQPPFAGKSLEQLQASATFLSAALAFVASLVGFRILQKNWGWQHFSRIFLLIVMGVLGVLTARSAYQASFINYEYATEFLVYAHAAPGPKEALTQIEEISQRIRGEREIKLAYDNNTRYPYWWYGRNYPNKLDFGENPSNDLKNYDVILAGGDTKKIESILKNNYIVYRYKRLWWPIEDYNRLTFTQVWTALKNPKMRSALFQIWFNKNYEPYAQLKGYGHLKPNTWKPADDMSMFIRKDIVAQIWNYGVSPSITEEQIVDPYVDKMTQLQPEFVISGDTTAAGSFNAPHGIAFAADGSFYLTDSRNNRVLHFTSSGELLQQWGSVSTTEPAAPGTFREPWGIAVAPDGSVFVADTWNHRIQRFSANGEYLNGWGYFGQAQTPDGMWGPRDIVVSKNGEVYVTDTGNKRIAIFNYQGEFLGQFGSSGIDLGQFDEQVGIAMDEEGSVYVADTWNQRIQVFQPDGGTKTYLPVRQWLIEGWYGQSLENKPFITVDKNANVYVADPEGFRVLVFDKFGTFLYGFGQYSAGTDGFGQVGGVEIAPDGSLWVADAVNNRVIKFAPKQ